MGATTHFNAEDIRPAALMADKQGCVDWDRTYLLARRDQWVQVACPACAADDWQLYGEKAGFVYVECRQCGTVYTNPRPAVGLLHAFYAQSKNYAYWNRHIFPATEAVRRDRIFRPRAMKVLSCCKKHRIKGETLLEIGAAFGIFCEEISRSGYFREVVAVEPTPDLARTCRERGLETIEKPIELISEPAIADVIAAFEVIEHVFSPGDFVRQCVRLLKPGGVLILTCPNVRGFDVNLLRTLSHTFDHEHLNYFHPTSLSRLLDDFGLSVIELATPGQLDAHLVREQVLSGVPVLQDQPFLRRILIDEWESLGANFQKFLADNRLSSHMWLVARLPRRSSGNAV